jgi:hypothetical protein
MKKLLHLWAAIGSIGTASLSPSFGQGFVNFSAGANVYTRIATNSSPGGPSTGFMLGPSSGLVYYFALFVAPSTTTNLAFPTFDPTQAGFTFTPGLGTNINSSIGRFNGNSSTDGHPVPGYPPSSTASFIIAGWSANIGSSWAEVQSWIQGRPVVGSPYFGLSGVATDIMVGGDIPTWDIFGTGPGQIPGFTLMLQTPEPSSPGLFTIGAVLLVMFRRKSFPGLATA